MAFMCITTEWAVVKPDERFRNMENYSFLGHHSGLSWDSRTQAIEIAFGMLIHNFYDLKTAVQPTAMFTSYDSS